MKSSASQRIVDAVGQFYYKHLLDKRIKAELDDLDKQVKDSERFNKDSQKVMDQQITNEVVFKELRKRQR